MSPSIPRTTIHSDSGGALKGVRSVVKIPDNELKRWRRTFDAHAQVLEGEK